MKIMLVVKATRPVHLPSGDSDPPIAAPWWPKGPVTACVDHEDGLDLVGWIAGIDKQNTDNLFGADDLESVLRMWCATYGRDWRFQTYCPATHETFDVELPQPKARKRKAKR